ncbi:17803_t:CDS:2, partial [Entrophospora sp. SA101]
SKGLISSELYNFTEKQKEVIDKLLLEDEINVPESGSDDVVSSLVKIGVISYLKSGESRVVGFTSPAKKLLSFFQRYAPMKEPLRGEFNLHDLTKEALSRIDIETLRNSLGRSKNRKKLLERVWQMELYRAIYSCLPPEIHLSPDVGHLFSTNGLKKPMSQPSNITNTNLGNLNNSVMQNELSSSSFIKKDTKEHERHKFSKNIHMIDDNDKEDLENFYPGDIVSVDVSVKRYRKKYKQTNNYKKSSEKKSDNSGGDELENYKEVDPTTLLLKIEKSLEGLCHEEIQFRPTKPVFNSIKKCRANFQNDELDTKAFIIKTKAEKNLTSTVTNFLAGIIELPQINVTYDGVDFVCPGSSSIGSLQAYTSFFSQVGTFIPITGLLFTIAVYGTKSIFGIMTTCLLDDIVILTTSFGPILWWYTYTKPLWYYGVIHEIKEDLIYDKDLINSIAIGIFFGSMLVYKYDEEKHIKDLLKDKKFQNIRRFFLNVKKYLFGKGVFESGPILEEIKKITGAEETCPLKHHNCERIKEAMKKRIKCRKKKTKKVKGEKENNDGPITIEVKRMRAENMVRINILETGALNYFIYSHRKDSEEEDKQKVQKVQKEKYIFKIREVP